MFSTKDLVLYRPIERYKTNWKRFQLNPGFFSVKYLVYLYLIIQIEKCTFNNFNRYTLCGHNKSPYNKLFLFLSYYTNTYIPHKKQRNNIGITKHTKSMYRRTDVYSLLYHPIQYPIPTHWIYVYKMVMFDNPSIAKSKSKLNKLISYPPWHRITNQRSLFFFIWCRFPLYHVYNKADN